MGAGSCEGGILQCSGHGSLTYCQMRSSVLIHIGRLSFGPWAAYSLELVCLRCMVGDSVGSGSYWTCC